MHPRRQAARLARRVHDAAGQIGLLDGPPGVRADLDDEDVFDAQLRDHAHDQGGDARGVGVGKLGQVGDAHEDLDVGKTAAQRVIAHKRLGEPVVDGV